MPNAGSSLHRRPTGMPGDLRPPNMGLRWLCLLGAGLTGALYAIHAVWSRASNAEPPIAAVMAWYLIAGALFLAAAAVSERWRLRGSQATFVIVCFATSFRLIQLGTPPILEVDGYRYLWDGRVAAAGLDPYRYSPVEVQRFAANIEREGAAPGELPSVLGRLANRSTFNRELLASIHFPRLTTIYPPVSQVVFAAAAGLAGDDASLPVRLLILKSLLLLFDFGTLALLARLLSLTRTPQRRLLLYAWNPLVIKEFANSGHCDAIAVFFLTAAATLLVEWLRDANASRAPRFGRLLLSACSFALAVGAKLFPIVLAPWAVAAIARRGARAALGYSLLVILLSAVLLAPMFRERAARQASDEGLATYLSQWRMNAWAFAMVEDNLRPEPTASMRENRPWSVFIPAATRRTIADALEQSGLGSNPRVWSRIVAMAAFGVFYIWILIRSRRRKATRGELRDAFLVIAVFFFLQPTENPWYWTWAAPLALFVRNPGWRFVSVALLVYYSRFWFEVHETEWKLGALIYHGGGCFDHVVVWWEHLAIIAAIVWGAARRRGSPLRDA